MRAFSFVVLVKNRTRRCSHRAPQPEETTVDNLLAVFVAVAANRTFARSALPDAPIVLAQPARQRRQLRRRISWKLRRIVDHLAPA
jgi:hypothetical protein